MLARSRGRTITLPYLGTAPPSNVNTALAGVYWAYTADQRPSESFLCANASRNSSCEAKVAYGRATSTDRMPRRSQDFVMRNGPREGCGALKYTKHCWQGNVTIPA